MPVMPTLLACSRLYNAAPRHAQAWNELFHEIGRLSGLSLRTVDWAAPARLEELWARPDLGMAFLCGRPYLQAGARHRIIAAPLTSESGERPVYRTLLLARASSGWNRIEDSFGSRLGRMPAHSQSGYNALRFMGMEDIANQHFSTLSGGEKQRVLIARSLAQEADILVLDEPTNHLDVHYQWLLMEVIAGLKKTVLSVFHELNLACAFCDYLFVLKDGRIAAQGTPREICTPQMLEEVFRVRADVLALEDGRPYIVYRGSIR